MHYKKYKYPRIPSAEITPEPIHASRREFMKGLGILSAGALLAACTPGTGAETQTSTLPETGGSAGIFDELNDPANTYEQITHYNNYYEFTTDKSEVARLAKDYQPRSSANASNWTVEVTGLVNKPQTFGLEDLLTQFTQEERIYRLRCVEAWSMVIPWFGFPLSRLLNDVEPKPEAKFVRFKSFYDPTQMPGDRYLPFPYFEGLRLDEAMHDLTILASGIYDKPLPSQDGAPIRLVVPWKYGFKSAKSIVSIELTAEMPSTFWSTLAPNEYGFYANVNPTVSHPRWSQSSERRIGELQRRATLMLNGYDQVSPLYQGMDLYKFY